MRSYAAKNIGNHASSHVTDERQAHSSGRTRTRSRAVNVIAMTGLLLAASPALAADADPPERERTVTVSPVEGRFRCGELLLTATSGTQTEIIDGRLKNGVVTVRIQRRYDRVTMAGSDGRVYRATAHVNAHFVLIAPDFDNPVRGHEIIHVSFHGDHGSPGYLNEHLRIRDGMETDEVTGTCEYAD